MRRVAIGSLLVLGAVVGLLVAACASPAATTNSQPVGQVGPSGSGGANAQGTMMPGGQGPGPRATAIATMRAGTPGPLRVQETQRDMTMLKAQLRILASNNPTGVQLIAMTQRASDLFFELSNDVPFMSSQELDQALSTMSDITTEMSQVVQTYANQVAATMTPGTMTPGTSTPAPTMQATPTPVTLSVAQMMAAIMLLRQQEMNLASDQPTFNDITSILGQMNQLLGSMHQQLSTLSANDLQNLTASMGQAMDDLVPVMQTRVRMDIGTVPTITPSQTVLPTLSATPTLGPTSVPPTATSAAATSTPMPAVAPTSTPVPVVAPTNTPMPPAATPTGPALVPAATPTP